MRILYTGFSPFGGETVNPAWEAVRRLPDTVAGAQILRMELPTSFRASGDLLASAMERLRPDAVICVGQAGGRAAVTPERIAVNLMDAAIPDNDGFRPVDMPICPGGPAAYFSTLPLRRIEAAVRAEGIPAALSCSAGTYVCNCLMYRLLGLAERSRTPVRAGFIHVPYAEEQCVGKPDGTPFLPLWQMVRALTAAAAAVADEDVKSPD